MTIAKVLAGREQVYNPALHAASLHEALPQLHEGSLLAIWDIDGVICNLENTSSDRLLSKDMLAFLKGCGTKVYFNTNGIIGDEHNPDGFIAMVKRSLIQNAISNGDDWRDYMPNILSGGTCFYDARAGRENLEGIAREFLGLTEHDQQKLLQLASTGLQDHLEQTAQKMGRDAALFDGCKLADPSIPSIMLAAVKAKVSDEDFAWIQQETETYLNTWITLNKLGDVFKVHHVPSGSNDTLVAGETVDFQVTTKTGKGAGIVLLLDKILQSQGKPSALAAAGLDSRKVLAMDDAALLPIVKNIFAEAEFPATVWSAIDTFHIAADAQGQPQYQGSDAAMVRYLSEIFGRDRLMVTQNDSMNSITTQAQALQQQAAGMHSGYFRSPMVTVAQNLARDLVKPVVDTTIAGYHAVRQQLAPNLIFPSTAAFTQALGIAIDNEQQQSAAQTLAAEITR